MNFILRNKSNLARIFISVLIVIILVYLGYYFYGKYKKLSQDYKKSQAMIKSLEGGQGELNTKDITDKVGKLIELPKEMPTVVTIPDITKLQNQPFFKSAQNGDRVLIFQNAQKAIIYREKANKIIEVGSITISQPSPSLSPTRSLLPKNTPTLIPTLLP